MAELDNILIFVKVAIVKRHDGCKLCFWTERAQRRAAGHYGVGLHVVDTPRALSGPNKTSAFRPIVLPYLEIRFQIFHLVEHITCADNALNHKRDWSG
jgi:hypothetical protein